MYCVARGDASVLLEHVITAEALGRNDGERLWLALTHTRRDDEKAILNELGLRFDIQAMHSFGRRTRIYLMAPRP